MGRHHAEKHDLAHKQMIDLEGNNPEAQNVVASGTPGTQPMAPGGGPSDQALPSG
jgi:hypothetical protein